MPLFSARSKDRLATCHPWLQELFNEVIKKVDCTILAGRRFKAEQDRLYKLGKSKVQYPNSKHNRYPSHAVDVAPYPVDWTNIHRFYMFVGYVRAVADQMNIPIRCGADWDSDWLTSDQTFDDLPHFELTSTLKIEKEKP